MNIKYGYFRHRLDASNDPKLQSLIQDVGLVGYAYYFTLLELYATQYNNGEKIDTKVKVHQRVIANTWHKRVDSCNKVLTKLQLSGLLVYTLDNSTYTIDIPNFLNYFGSYGKMKQELSLKKRKEKKRKENIYIGNITPDGIVQLWNEKMPKHDFKYCHGLGMDKHLKKFLEAVNFLDTKEKWNELFTRCIESKKLSGDNNINWKANLLWLVDYDNALKVLNEDYKEDSVIDKIDFNL